MKTTREFSNEILKEGNVFRYQNSTATYHITFIQDSSILNKYEILCHKDQLQIALTKELDMIINPETYDSLDKSVCVYEVSEELGTIFFLSSFNAQIQLVEGYEDSRKNNRNPFFDILIENKDKRIKSFKDFK